MYGPLPTAGIQRLHGGKQKPGPISSAQQSCDVLTAPFTLPLPERDNRVLPCLLSVSDHVVRGREVALAALERGDGLGFPKLLSRDLSGFNPKFNSEQFRGSDWRLIRK